MTATPNPRLARVDKIETIDKINTEAWGPTVTRRSTVLGYRVTAASADLEVSYLLGSDDPIPPIGDFVWVSVSIECPEN